MRVGAFPHHPGHRVHTIFFGCDASDIKKRVHATCSKKNQKMRVTPDTIRDGRQGNSMEKDCPDWGLSREV